EIAFLTKSDISIQTKFICQPAEQVERELGQADVFDDRELLADRRAGKRRGRMGKAGIALDKSNRVRKSFLAQIIGKCAAHDRASYDSHVISHIRNPAAVIAGNQLSGRAARCSGTCATTMA